MRQKSIHETAIVEIAGEAKLFRCFVKGNIPNYQGGQDLEAEYQTLANIGHKISDFNPHTRSPRALAFFPSEELLFLELVEGRTLKSILFDLQPSKHNLSSLLDLTGEWLAQFHRITQVGEGNPFDWLEEQFEVERVRQAFCNCSVSGLYDSALSMIREYRRRNPNFRRPLCQTHGEFTPLHVLVNQASIYVIDFGSIHQAFPYEDVALFTTFYDGLQPWRRATGLFRMPFREQKNRFLRSYIKHYKQEDAPVDEIVASFFRIVSMARHEVPWERAPKGWLDRVYLKFGRSWMRRRFVAVVRQELKELRILADAEENEGRSQVQPLWA
jgi:aminoglycoside phosphotransferase (APT) family kinase protein